MPAVFFDAFTRFGTKANIHAAQPWKLLDIVDEMNHCSISAAMVAHTMTVQYDPMLENLRLCDMLSEYDNLFPVWNVMPHWTGEFPGPDKLWELMETNQVKAVTVYPKTNGWDIASQYSTPLLKGLEDHGSLVIVDMRTEMDESTLETLLTRHPNLNILIVGVSWARQRCIFPLLLNHKNLHISFDHFQINYGIEHLVELGCEDQLLYASNAADMSMGAHRCYVDYAQVSDTVRQKIAGGNLTRLTHGLVPPREIVNEYEDVLMAEARKGKPLSAVVYDMHAHMLDEGLHGGGGSYAMYNGGPEGTVEMSRRLGIDRMGIMSWNGTVGVDPDKGNQCVKSALDFAPNFFWGLATFDVTHDDPEILRQKLEEVYIDRRFLGLKPYIYHGKHYDDPAFDVLWEFAAERNLYVLLHPQRGDLSELDVLCGRYPEVTFVAAHCGGSYEVADHAIRLANKHPNFMIEITLTPVCLGIIDYLAEGAGASRVMYGSDQPMRDMRQQLGWVVFSQLSEDDKRQILGLNAMRLLNS